MSTVHICGLGAVSPAGWGVQALRAAVEKGEPLPLHPLTRPGWEQPFRSRQVPLPVAKPACLAHPRLRRTSPLSHYAAACALEAVSAFREHGRPDARFGVIVCLHSGCVQYTCRFFEEILRDPTTASPMLFPETVFAAPASHVAALLGTAPLVYTLIGDPASYLQGVALAADWLEEGRVDACIVIGAEENNWVRADALWHLERGAVMSDGAGALCLSLDPAASLGVELEAITDAHTFRTDRPKHEAALSLSSPGREGRGEEAACARQPTSRAGRAEAALAMRQQLPPNSAAELLCDGLGNGHRSDAAERRAWRDWTGQRLSLKRLLGEGLMAGAAWQCIAAINGVAQGQFTAANVSLVGCNQQAIGSRFIRTKARTKAE